MIQSIDPEGREEVLKQNLGNQLNNTTTETSQTITVPRGREPFSVVPQIPAPELQPEESSVAQLPEIESQQVPSLPTLPETRIPVIGRQNARRIVPSDDSLEIAQQRRNRPSPDISPFEETDANSAFIEHGC